MTGYDGIETLAFKVLSRVLSQADLDISVSRDKTTVPSLESAESEHGYDIHAAETRELGFQNAKVCYLKKKSTPSNLFTHRVLYADFVRKLDQVLHPTQTIQRHVRPFSGSSLTWTIYLRLAKKMICSRRPRIKSRSKLLHQ